MSGAFIIILVLIILLVLFVPLFGQQFKVGRGVNRQLIRKHWRKVESYLQQGGIGTHRAITEADKLVDYVLRKQGYVGENMGERLRSAEPRFSSLDGLWQAHKLRNRLVHETGFDVGLPRAKKALSEFRRALRDLGAL